MIDDQVTGVRGCHDVTGLLIEEIIQPLLAIENLSGLSSPL